MLLSADKINIFVNERKDKEGKTFKTYSTTINSKQEDGTFISVSVRVRTIKTAEIAGTESISRLLASATTSET